jgi:hypothetical protein
MAGIDYPYNMRHPSAKLYLKLNLAARRNFGSSSLEQGLFSPLAARLATDIEYQNILLSTGVRSTRRGGAAIGNIIHPPKKRLESDNKTNCLHDHIHSKNKDIRVQRS